MAKSRAIAVAEAAKELNVSESTIYKYIKQQGVARGGNSIHQVQPNGRG